MATENKVRFNLKNVHYAKQTGAYTWATPVAVPGAVTLTLDAVGDVTPFYADGITYYRSIGNNGYSGSLEMARYPDVMLEDIWGMSLGGTSKVLTENNEEEPAVFALLYQIDGDQDNEFYVLYDCVGTRPGLGSTTNTDVKNPQTQTSNISAGPMANGAVMARTTADTPDATKNNWFNAVFVEAGTT